MVALGCPSVKKNLAMIRNQVNAKMAEKMSAKPNTSFGVVVPGQEGSVGSAVASGSMGGGRTRETNPTLYSRDKLICL